MTPDPTTGLQLLALLGLLGLAVLTDLRERRIPNRLTVSGALVGTLLTAVQVGGFPTSSLAGIALALAVAFPLFALGGLGAGDVKLLAAVAAFVGPAGLLPVVLYGGLAGGLLAVASAVRRGVVLALLLETRNLLVWLATLGRRGRRRTLDASGAHAVPYGVAIAVGAVAAWFFPISLAVAP